MLETTINESIGEWSPANLVDPCGYRREPEEAVETSTVDVWPIKWSRRSVGLLSNKKPNADAMLEEVQRGLLDVAPDLTFVYGFKEPLAEGAPESVIESLSNCDVVVLASAECGGCTSWVCQDYITLERRGVPCVIIATDRFEKLARHVLASDGVTSPHMAIPKHPVSGITAEQAQGKIRAVLGQITDQLFGLGVEAIVKPVGTVNSMSNVAQKSAQKLAKGAQFGPEEVSDGLPIFPPSRDRIRPLLDYMRVDGAESIGTVPPGNGILTYEVAAANAAMTGCSPAQFHVVTEIMKTILGGEFNLLSIQATTHPAGPCVLVSGPIAAEVGIHGGSGCMGPGWPANARIGRAVRLILMNVGAARPGGQDMATFGELDEHVTHDP